VKTPTRQQFLEREAEPEVPFQGVAHGVAGHGPQKLPRALLG